MAKAKNKEPAKEPKPEPVTDDDGVLVLNINATEGDADRLNARRLKMAADMGDEEAAAELRRMEKTPCSSIVARPPGYNKVRRGP